MILISSMEEGTAVFSCPLAVLVHSSKLKRPKQYKDTQKKKYLHYVTLNAKLSTERFNA